MTNSALTHRVSGWRTLGVLALVLLALPAAAEVLSLESLRNAEYASAWTASGRAPLRDGQYREPAAPGSVTEVRVSVLDLVASWSQGGTRYAAVVLATDPGGSGTFYDLAVVEARAGRAVHLTSTELGDRVRVESLTVRPEADRAELDVGLVGHASGDPQCCPTRRVTRRFRWTGGSLRSVGGATGPFFYF
jgi:hypothetical protein